MRSGLFRAVAVAFVDHRDFPDSQGRAHNIRLAPGIGIPKFHSGKLCMPQAFFDQLSCRFAWAFVNTHGEAIETRSLFIRHFNVDGLHAGSILPERKTSAAIFSAQRRRTTQSSQARFPSKVGTGSASTECTKDSERCGALLD